MKNELQQTCDSFIYRLSNAIDTVIQTSTSISKLALIFFLKNQKKSCVYTKTSSTCSCYYDVKESSLMQNLMFSKKKFDCSQFLHIMKLLSAIYKLRNKTWLKV